MQDVSAPGSLSAINLMHHSYVRSNDDTPAPEENPRPTKRQRMLARQDAESSSPSSMPIQADSVPSDSDYQIQSGFNTSHVSAMDDDLLTVSKRAQAEHSQRQQIPTQSFSPLSNRHSLFSDYSRLNARSGDRMAPMQTASQQGYLSEVPLPQSQGGQRIEDLFHPSASQQTVDSSSSSRALEDHLPRAREQHGLFHYSGFLGSRGEQTLFGGTSRESEHRQLLDEEAGIDRSNRFQ